MDRSQLARELDDLVERCPYDLCVAVRDSDGWAWGHQGERVVPSASTIKVPLLVAALHEVERRRLDLSAQVALPAASERVGGAGPLQLLPSVQALPLGEVLSLMIALSDNDATNAVLDLLGFEAVQHTLARVPTRHTVLQRRMMDVAAAAAGRQNLTCTSDLVAVLVALREGRLLGPELTAEAIRILRTQQFREGLPAYLPPEVLVASKTGDLAGLRADMALLERSERWVAVAVVADGLTDAGEGGATATVDRGTAVLPTFAELGQACAALL